MGRLMGEAFTLKPGIQCQMLTYRLDQDEDHQPSPGDPPPRSHWERVIRETELSPGQLDEIAACWEVHAKAMVSGDDASSLLSGS